MKKNTTSIATTGFGFDSHAFSQEGTLSLGGLPFAGTPALAGHSDGDAVIHALIDALLGAASLGDIGELFPDTSKKLKGISSLLLLQETMKKLRTVHAVPVHVDITVVAEKPRLSAHKKKMAVTLAKQVGLPSSMVNVKAKTPEGLMWFLPQGGIAAWAVATVSRPS